MGRPRRGNDREKRILGRCYRPAATSADSPAAWIPPALGKIKRSRVSVLLTRNVEPNIEPGSARYTGQLFGRSGRSFLYSGSSAFSRRSLFKALTTSSWLIFSELASIPVVSSKPRPQLRRQPRIL